MTVGILTEKPSAAKAMAAALAGQKGSFEGTDYVIAHARGHLYELAQPEAQVSNATGDEIAALKSWDLGNLPWDLSRFDWKLVPIKGASQVIQDVRRAFAGVDEIAIATDVDPSGEGGAIAINLLKELGLDKKKKISRMYFTDEAPTSLQKAFRTRKDIPDVDQFDEYLMSQFRSAWDFASMQFTRVATVSAAQRVVCRNGRLKSAIVLFVGDQRKAHDNYVKVTRFQNRFRDENGVLYTDPDEPTYAAEADVPRTFNASKVVLDSRQNKRTAPRALLDLAALSSRLSSKGITAAQVLATYQSMYEAQVVSYPRTGDKTITTEQFNELLPLVDKIAAVVGVDTSLLTHRKPRRTHVKDSGAHGANRPGPKVPSSLDELKQKFGPAAKYIYEELARSYLAMLAEDYVYEAQEGHVADYPSFVGRCSVPKDPGWKRVFKDSDDDSEDDSTTGLGENADPIVYEIVPPRPPQPTMKWLMKQLEKRDVGTGATRTSTYAEVTNPKSKSSLLAESRGKITLTEVGEVNYRLLPNTHIGDLSITEQVFSAMREIADGKTTMDVELAKVADLVRDDITTMKANAASMRKELGLSEQVQQKEKFTGTWKKTGQSVTFNREWGGHRFDDAECQRLLNDEEVAFSAVSARTGNPYDVYGKLGEGSFEGNKYIGFQKLGFGKKDSSGNPLPPSKWGGRTFSQEEQDKLAAGEKVFAKDFVSKKSGRNYETTVRFGEVNGEWKMIPAFSDDF